MASEEEAVVCLVCGDSAAGVHVGVNTCRACAAFFRRIVALGRKYDCRGRPPARCRIPPKDRKACKKCRYDRCIEIGMLPEAANPKYTVHVDEIAVLQEIPSTSGAAECDLLKMVVDKYQRMTDERRALEFSVLPLSESDSTTVLQTDHGMVRRIDFTQLFGVLIVAVPHFKDFIYSLLPRELHALDNFKMRQKLGLYMTLFEGMYRTARTFPVDNEMRHISVTGYVDYSKHADSIILPDKDSGPEHEAMAAVKKMIVMRAKSNETAVLRNTFRRLQLDDVEVAAFVAISTWTLPTLINVEISEDVLKYCSEHRETVFRNLHTYYRYSEKYSGDYAVRLGEIMTLPTKMHSVLRRLEEEQALLLMFKVPQRAAFYNLFNEQW